MNKPLILVTNDDGMFAPGIKMLVNIAAEIGTPFVVAPNKPQSGQGHAITIEEPLRLHKVDVFEGIEAYECSGTPADCVKLAKNILLKDKKIDLCISGINHGSNASINIIYSGTMSAAMEASLENIPSIGFSLLDFSFDADFNPGKFFIKKIIQKVLAIKISKQLLLNVNIPNIKKIKGIRICHQAEGLWVEEYQEGEDPRGQKYYWLSGYFKSNDKNPNSDISALEKGYVSVVPSHHNLTKYDQIEELEELDFNS